MGDKAVTWTKQQAHVIDTRCGNLLVAAAAGSGKTAVLVERIIEMVMGVDSAGNKLPDKDRVNVDELLVVTFTNAAASQMKEKIRAALQKKIDDYMAKGIYDEHLIKQMTLINHAEICTIDSFCLHIVKEYFSKVQLDSAFDIGDKTEMEIIKKDVLDQVMESCYADENLVPGFIKLVRTFAVKERDTAVPELVNHLMLVISSYPDRHSWIQDARMALDVSVDEKTSYEDKCRVITKLPLVRLFAERACNTIVTAHNMALECQKYATEDNNLENYGERIDRDVDMLTHMVKLCDKSGDSPVNLFDIKNLYTDSLRPENQRVTEDAEGRKIYYAFDRLVAAKKDADPELAQFIKNSRSVYKKMITDLMSVIIDVDDVIGQIKLVAPVLNALLDLTELYMDELMKVKRDKNLFEFHDIEEFAFRILCDGVQKDDDTHTSKFIPSKCGIEVSRRYREIFIDEYQDSNFIQEYILGSVSGHGEGINNIFMVGDVKQSIYKFRMARPDLFLGKYDLYKRLENDEQASADTPGNCIVLTRNFRSEINVLKTVNALFEQLMRKDVGGIEYDEAAKLNSRYAVEDAEGHMYEPDDVDQGPKSELIMIDADVIGTDIDEDYVCSQIEAKYIADKIHQLVDGEDPLYITDSDTHERRKAEYSDIVILMRSVSTNSVIYDSVFEDAGIPIYIQSESGYFGAVEVSCVVSMLSVIDNSYVDSDLAAVLRSPMVGLDEEELARIVGEYRIKYELSGRDYNARLYDKLIDYMETHEYETHSDEAVSDKTDKTGDDRMLDKISSFVEMLDYLKENKSYMSISDIIRYVLDRTGFYWFIGARPMGKRRQANIDMLIKKADDFEQNSKGVFNFIRYVNELKTHSLDFAEADMVGDKDNVVRVMTMHKSKGLEFPVLFVAGLGTGFNNKDLQKKVLVHQKYYLTTQAIDADARVKRDSFLRRVMSAEMKTENYAEELRVLYVALTRAKEKLYMTGCVKSLDKYKEKLDVYAVGSGMSSAALMRGGRFLDWIYTALHFIDYRDFLEVHEVKSTDFISSAETEPEYTEEIVTKETEIKETGIKETEIKETGIKENRIDSLGADSVESGDPEKEQAEDIYNQIKKGIEFRYGHGSSGLKSKMSITEIKKLQAMGENDSFQMPGKERIYVEKDKAPIPEFLSGEKIIGGNDVGTVYHKIMELADFQQVSDSGIEADVERIFDLGIFGDIYRTKIHPNKIVNMIKSSLGQRMAAADKNGQLFRERQFYMMMTPEEILGSRADIDPDNDETIVVQGIIDAYFIEDGEIVLMDYKTDTVKKAEDLVQKYHVQLDKYADVLEQLTGLKVKEKIIYSFCLDTTVNL